MIRLLTAASTKTRVDAALDVVRRALKDDPVILVGASRGAADEIAYAITRDVGATFGLQRFSAMQLVSVLATPSLAERGLAPATPLGTEATANRVTFEARESGALTTLANVSRFPGFARALASTLGELRLGGVSTDALSPAPDVAHLLARYEGALTTAGLADRAALFRLARERVNAGDTVLDGATLLLLDVPLTSKEETDFWHAVARVTGTFVVTMAGADTETIRRMTPLGAVDALPDDVGEGTSLGRLRRFLFSKDTPETAEPDEAVQFFSAPGEGREALEIARHVLDEVRRGVRFDDMAVFVRDARTYVGLLETAFRRARIPAHFARGARQPDPAGRAFLALIGCATERLSATRFAEYLSFGQLPDLTAAGAPPTDRAAWVGPEEESLHALGRDASPQLSLFTTPEPPPDRAESPLLRGSLRAPWKWEELLVEAAVIGGRDRWRRRLRGLENELTLKRDRIQDEDPESPRQKAFERDLANLAHLTRFALPVIERLDALPDTATWREWLRRLAELAPMVLRDPERVLATLAELEPMGDVGAVTLDEVREVLAERLTNLERGRDEPRFGAVFVGTPDLARGRAFRVVFVPGLAERVFPERPREDPLLLDRVREALDVGLHTQEDRGREERLRLRLAVAAASERLFVSYPRIDVAEARPRVPSFYGLDITRATRGALPDYEHLEREAAARTNARLAWPAPEDPAHAVDAIEHDLAVLGALLHDTSDQDRLGRARYLLELNEHLARSLRNQWVRWRTDKWQPGDGIVGVTDHTRPALARNRVALRPYSATALQRFATCPYQFLLAAIHRLEPRPEAAALIKLDPLTRGSMFHDMQEETFRELKEADRLPVVPDNVDKAEAVLLSVIERVAKTYEDRLAPAIQRVWEDELEVIRTDLRTWVRRLANDGDTWMPVHFEYAFGLPPDRGKDPASVPDPVTIPGGWKLRGAIDLVEQHRTDGTYQITDHKTGRDTTAAGMLVGGGERLQPVLYSLALEQILSATVTHARLYFCTSRGGFSDRVVTLDERARWHGREVLDIIDRAIGEGHLPPAPRAKACTYCDFLTICGPDAERRARRKKGKVTADLEQIRSLP